MEEITTTRNVLYYNDSFQKRVEKYLRLSHQTLAEMLALLDEEKDKSKPNDSGNQLAQPNYPNTSELQPYTYTKKWCPVSMRECTNPFGDCIDCPYHRVTVYNTKYTTTCTSTDLDNLTTDDIGFYGDWGILSPKK